MDDGIEGEGIATTQHDEIEEFSRGYDLERYSARIGIYNQICRRTEISVKFLDYLRKS